MGDLQTTPSTSIDFWSQLAESLHRGTLRSLVLSKRRSEAVSPFESLRVRPVRIRGAERFQFASRSGGKETHENLDADAALQRLQQLFGPVFEHCHVFGEEADYVARFRRDGRVKFQRRPPSGPARETGHDRAKNYLIPEGRPCPYLEAIGVMTASGRVRAAKYGKFRQVNRFLELVEDAVAALPEQGRLNVVDFGCGKSYLTFALHHLLTAVHGRQVDIVGLDRNADVIRECTRIVQRLDCPGLRFQEGDIAGFDPAGHVHLAVSLHACDTATDEALAQAVRWQAEVILAVPCCQHELAGRIEAEELTALLEHGILRERFAALATDALRAAALEICGYRTQVVEFIDLEHTAKNVLLRAVRRQADSPATARHVAAYRRLKQLLHLERIHLETALGEEFIARSLGERGT